MFWSNKSTILKCFSGICQFLSVFVWACVLVFYYECERGFFTVKVGIWLYVKVCGVSESDLFVGGFVVSVFRCVSKCSK